MRRIFVIVQTLIAASAAFAAPLPSGDADVRSAFEKKRNEAWGCYEKALVADPLTRGKVRLRVELADNGKVERAALESSEITNSDFQRCLLDAAKTWSFEDVLDSVSKNDKGVRVAAHEYAFVSDPTLAPISSKPKAQNSVTESAATDPAGGADVPADAPIAPDAK